MAVTDEQMRERLARTREYTVMILKAGPNRDAEGRDATVWEHGRRNFELREAGRLAIVCPVPDDSEVCGIGIFDAGVDEVAAIMADDPAVQAGIFVYETHPCRGFPGDALPG